MDDAPPPPPDASTNFYVRRTYSHSTLLVLFFVSIFCLFDQGGGEFLTTISGLSRIRDAHREDEMGREGEERERERGGEGEHKSTTAWNAVRLAPCLPAGANDHPQS